MADRRDLAARGEAVLDQALAPGPAGRRPVRVLAGDLTGAADSAPLDGAADQAGLDPLYGVK